MSVQCRMCESGEYNSLESLREHLEKVHELDQGECEQYAGDFSHDIDVLLLNELKEKIEKIKEWAFNMDCIFEDCTYLSHEKFNEDIRSHLERLIKIVGRWIPPEIRDQREIE